LTRLEYLEIGLAEWRALLDAGTVPRSLLAAGISGYSLDPAEADEVYNALIRLWGGAGLRGDGGGRPRLTSPVNRWAAHDGQANRCQVIGNVADGSPGAVAFAGRRSKQA
jgi:hypothetical protein